MVATLVFLATISAVTAAPADWSSYLCRYNVRGVERAQVVRVNEKEQRVLLDDQDATAVKLTPGNIRFGGPRGDWLIQLDRDGNMVTMRGMEIGQGKCSKIEV